MKKELNLRLDDTSIILESTKKSVKKFCISIEQLQFDTSSFYESIFSDVNEHIEIAIKKDVSITHIDDPKTQRIIDHVYDTIVSVTNQICQKLNEECFDK